MSEVFTDVFDLREQNVKVSEACVNRRPYIRSLTKNTFNKNRHQDKGTDVKKCELVSWF